MHSVATETQPHSTTVCAQCGTPLKPKAQMTSDAPLVCANCRCCRCGIVLSQVVCRCGVSHGKPSAVNRLCERCHELLESAAPSEPSIDSPRVTFAAEDAASPAAFFRDDDLEDLDESELDPDFETVMA